MITHVVVVVVVTNGRNIYIQMCLGMKAPVTSKEKCSHA